jgi:uroporphyrinogen-III synthase
VRVVLAREHGHNEGLRAWLPDGVDVREVPLTTTHYLDLNDVREALLSTPFVGDYHALVVTSARSARYVEVAKEGLSRDARIFSVGSATSLALDGVAADADVEGEGGARDLAAQILEGPVLLLGAATTRAELPAALRARGLEVTKLVGYETRPAVLSAEDVQALKNVDVVFVGAPSAWQVAEGLIDERALVVVPGETTGNEVRRSHERVFVGWGPATLEHLRTL